MKTILITGGAGFIGATLVKYILNKTDYIVVNIDNLTYASGEQSLTDIKDNPRHIFYKADIADQKTITDILEKHTPDAVMNLAAETHVDRSIDSPDAFMQTNIIGTYALLECVRHYWSNLSDDKKSDFRFHHISTDEVYGDLEKSDPAFTETTPYAPSSPYSASKASSDHLVRAWYRTYGLPILITNCSNNYGPYQFPEKLIPHMILNALHGKPLPVYGDGQQIRDWLYVEDHADALLNVIENGVVGETYNIGGQCEMANIDVVTMICDILNELRPTDTPYQNQITYVTDRPGHDRRYAIDITKIQTELGWTPSHNFAQGLRATVEWYLENQEWWQDILGTSYKLERIGTSS